MRRAHRPYRYRTEAERKAAKIAAKIRYNQKNKDILKEYNRELKREKYRKDQEAKGLTVKPYKTREFE